MFWKKHPRFLGIIAAGPIVWHNNISFSTVQYSRVEWFSTFCDFQNWTHCCQSVQFQNQKINKLGRAPKVFIFKKFTGTLKINIFSLFSNISFDFKETIAKKKIWTEKNVKPLKRDKLFSLFWVFNKTKKTIPQAQA